MNARNNVERSRVKNSLLAVCLILTSLSSGCAYQDRRLFANTQALIESGAPTEVKAVFSPLVFLFDAGASPVTAYLDALVPIADPPDELWLSYLGTRIIAESDLPVICKFGAGLFVIPLDTALFPAMGVADATSVVWDTPPEPPEKLD